MINRIINRNLRQYERDLPIRDRLNRWHRERILRDAGPIMWTLRWLWCYRPFQWLYQLRCRNVTWRMQRHNRRVLAKAPDLYDWGR